MNNKCVICKEPTNNSVLCDKCIDMVILKNEKMTLSHFIKSTIDFLFNKKK